VALFNIIKKMSVFDLPDCRFVVGLLSVVLFFKEKNKGSYIKLTARNDPDS
jgi:hypothetical protein